MSLFSLKRGEAIRPEPVRAAILGVGRFGQALGRALCAAGHTVTFGAPEREAAAEVARTFEQPVAAGTFEEACAAGDVVFLCVSWQGVWGALRGLGSAQGRILVDCTNPLSPSQDELLIGRDDSGAEQIARWAPGAKVVKALGHLPLELLSEPVLWGESAPVAFVCGDDGEAATLVARLIADLGFEPVDAGALKSARYLEPMALLQSQALGPEAVLALVRRDPGSKR